MPRPLDGLRVVDLSSVLAGPYCSYQLALLGAEVIKVERPGSGDWARGLVDDPGSDGMNPQFLAQNADKHSVTIDLKDARGLALVKRLAAGADVFIENFTPGTAQRLGLGYAALVAANPRLVYCSISGYGQDGPFSQRPAYDHVIQAMSGVMSVTGTEETVPNRIGPPMIDYITGIYAAFAVLAALRERERSGAAQHVDVAMLDCAIAAMASFVSAAVNGGIVPRPVGNVAASGSPASGVFRTKAGDLSLAANHEGQVRALLAAVGREDLLADPRYAEPTVRRRNAAAFRAEIANILSARTADEWENLLAAAHVPAARVRTILEILAEPQVAARNLLAEVASGERSLRLSTIGFKLNGEAPGPRVAPSRLGADTDAVLAALGMSGEEIAALRAGGVI